MRLSYIYNTCTECKYRIKYIPMWEVFRYNNSSDCTTLTISRG